MTRRQTASIPLAMGSRFYLPPPPVRVHSGLHSINQCSGCTSFQPNPLRQYTLLPEARVLTERIWLRGHAVKVIAPESRRNSKNWSSERAPSTSIIQLLVRCPPINSDRWHQRGASYSPVEVVPISTWASGTVLAGRAHHRPVDCYFEHDKANYYRNSPPAFPTCPHLQQDHPAVAVSSLRPTRARECPTTGKRGYLRISDIDDIVDIVES